MKAHWAKCTKGTLGGCTRATRSHCSCNINVQLPAVAASTLHVVLTPFRRLCPALRAAAVCSACAQGSTG